MELMQVREFVCARQKDGVLLLLDWTGLLLFDRWIAALHIVKSIYTNDSVTGVRAKKRAKNKMSVSGATSVSAFNANFLSLPLSNSDITAKIYHKACLGLNHCRSSHFFHSPQPPLPEPNRADTSRPLSYWSLPTWYSGPDHHANSRSFRSIGRGAMLRSGIYAYIDMREYQAQGSRRIVPEYWRYCK